MENNYTVTWLKNKFDNQQVWKYLYFDLHLNLMPTVNTSSWIQKCISPKIRIWIATNHQILCMTWKYSSINQKLELLFISISIREYVRLLILGLQRQAKRMNM